jgi:orotate phosphoribosyltransferase
MVATTPRLHPEIVLRLEENGLIRHGHFAFRSGRHSAVLVDRDRLIADPDLASKMGYALAKAFFIDHIDTVAAPSIWGAGLAQFVGYFLDPKAKVVYATPHPNGQRTIAANLRDVVAGQRVLLVDNIIISGQTIRHLASSIEQLGGTVIGIGTLWDSAEEQNGYPVVSLLNEVYPAYPPDDCPECATGEVAVERISY